MTHRTRCHTRAHTWGDVLDHVQILEVSRGLCPPQLARGWSEPLPIVSPAHIDMLGERMVERERVPDR